MNEGIPPFLTIEEAARLLRIGRTKAYAMAKEWRETGGRSGLPVIDLGDVLRVPREGIEELLRRGRPGTPARKVEQRGLAVNRPEPPAAYPQAPAPPRNCRHPRQPPNQLLLFEAFLPPDADRQQAPRP